MPQPIKLIVGPSPHYHQLKSGEIKYQKSKSAKPIWRILLLDEDRNLMHTRAYATQPSAEDIERIVMGILSAENLFGADIVVPTTVEKLCPGLQRKLMDQGAKVYLPAHGFASGSRASRQSDEFFVYLDMFMNHVRESMASCEEIASAAGSDLGVVTTSLWRDDEKDRQQIDVAHRIGEGITHLRGRDPEVGRKTREGESVWAPPNKGKHIPPHEDNLSALLGNLDHPIFLQKTGLRGVVLQLKKIKDAEKEQKLPLIRELGATVVLHQIAGIHRGRRDFLFDLRFYLRDEALRYFVSLGVKEALKMLIILNDGLLQVSAAEVAIHYPQDCSDLHCAAFPPTITSKR